MPLNRFLIPRPDILAYLLVAGMAALRFTIPGAPLMAPTAALLVGLPLVAAGMGLAVLAKFPLQRADTTAETFGIPAAVVRGGPYARSRNPMYLGMGLMLLGAAVAFNQPYGLAGAAFFVLACHFGYIPYEEAKMRTLFGVEYEDYARAVRRWI